MVPQADDSDPSAFASRMTIATYIRCLLAVICSHVAAPYAAARLTIRYQLQGDFELRYAMVAGIAVTIGVALSFRQLVNQPSNHKWLLGITGIILWIVVSFVLLAIAATSTIPTLILGMLWAGGSFWIVWSIWAYSFFRSTGVLAGAALVGLSAVPFWSLVEATGLSGNAQVEFAWRKPASLAMAVTASNEISSTGPVVWAGYLGTTRDGVIANAALSEDWTGHPPQILWTKNCGLGWSSFAVTENILFGQEQLSTGDCVTARDLNTGELLWTTAEDTDGFTSGLGGDGPRATPTLHLIEGDESSRLVLFAVGPTGLLRCLDASTGEVVWKQYLMEEFPGKELIHGVCGSPLIIGDTVVVAPTTDAGPSLAAFDSRDGTLIWQCASDWQASYASPALMTICNRPQIVFHAGSGILGINPTDGTVLWQYEWTNEFKTNATQPLQELDHPNDLFVATGYKGGAARITITETDSGKFQVKTIWSTRKTMKTKFCSIAQFGNALVGLDNGILCAVDINRGERLWKKGRYGHGQMLKVGEHLLIVEEKGNVRILKPGTKGHNPVGDSVKALNRKTWNHPVLIDDRLILRNDQKIVCVQLPLQGGAESQVERKGQNGRNEP